MANTEILLESGTNEIEVMQFTIFGELYGINVAKVLEIMMADKVKPIPHSHDAVEGIFKPRETLLTVINLPKYLTGECGDKKDRDLFIITNFNKLDIAFHVDSVLGIHTVSWTEIIKPEVTISTAEEGVAIGIVKKEDRLIIILDFEKIVTDINPETGLKISDINELGERHRSTVPILIAEDSALLNKLIVDCLKKAGYENLIHVENGKQAYDIITHYKDQGTLHENVRVVISDIEMPEMDGHRLTKLIKTDEATAKIPVVLFSSLVNEEMRRKGESLGADAQLSKPEIGNLVKIIDQLVAERHLDM